MLAPGAVGLQLVLLPDLDLDAHQLVRENCISGFDPGRVKKHGSSNSINCSVEVQGIKQ